MTTWKQARQRPQSCEIVTVSVVPLAFFPATIVQLRFCLVALSMLVSSVLTVVWISQPLAFSLSV